VANPDYDKHPALKLVEGHKCTISNGETLFIPSLFWHHITYTEGGYSLSLRANDSVVTKARGLWNLTQHFFIDKGMNAMIGKKWKDFKISYANKRALEKIL